MKVLADLGDMVQIQCDCGRIFWSDAAMEDNCYWDEEKRCNYPQCPKCEKIMRD
jgi:hypothetical protein